MTILICSMLRLYKLWLPDEEYFRKEVSYLKYMLVPTHCMEEKIGWFL